MTHDTSYHARLDWLEFQIILTYVVCDLERSYVAVFMLPVRVVPILTIVLLVVSGELCGFGTLMFCVNMFVGFSYATGWYTTKYFLSPFNFK